MMIRVEKALHPLKGKLADAELQFTEGELKGMKLVGFAIWDSAPGLVNVTMPSRPYMVGGNKRNYSLLRSTNVTDATMLPNKLRVAIVVAYNQLLAQKGEPQVKMSTGGYQEKHVPVPEPTESLSAALADLL